MVTITRGHGLLAMLLVACGDASGAPEFAGDLEDSGVVPGSVVRFTGATGCATSGNTLPWIHTMSPAAPRVDAWFPLVAARGTTPLLSDPPIVAVWLIGHEKLTPAFSTPVAPGCWLLVEPFVGMVCPDRDPLAPLASGARSGAWREGPHAYLLLRPVPDLLGRSLFVQLVCQAPGENVAELLVSQAVELMIGNTEHGGWQGSPIQNK